MISLFKNRFASWMMLFLATLFLCSSVGCHTWKKPYLRNPFSRSTKDTYPDRKNLGDAPMFNPGTEDLQNHAKYLRNSQPKVDASEKIASQKPPKKWYQPPFLMSSEAAEIDEHLGK